MATAATVNGTRKGLWNSLITRAFAAGATKDAEELEKISKEAEEREDETEKGEGESTHIHIHSGSGDPDTEDRTRRGRHRFIDDPEEAMEGIGQRMEALERQVEEIQGDMDMLLEEEAAEGHELEGEGEGEEDWYRDARRRREEDRRSRHESDARDRRADDARGKRLDDARKRAADRRKRHEEDARKREEDRRAAMSDDDRRAEDRRREDDARRRHDGMMDRRERDARRREDDSRVAWSADAMKRWRDDMRRRHADAMRRMRDARWRRQEDARVCEDRLRRADDALRHLDDRRMEDWDDRRMHDANSELYEAEHDLESNVSGGNNEEIEANLELEAPPGTGDRARRANDSTYLETAFRDTVSMAEIIRPGIKPLPAYDQRAAPKATLDAIVDLRRRALTEAYYDSATRSTIESLAAGRTLDSMNHDALRQTFIAVAGVRKAQNNTAGGDRRGMIPVHSGRPSTPAELNAAAQEFWGQQAR